MTNESVKHMKWWGWGNLDKQFEMNDKPALWPFITQAVGIENNLSSVSTPPVEQNDIQLPEANLQDDFIDLIETFLNPDQIKSDKHERLVHCYGKSFRDLWRIRNGIISSAPDCICYPESEKEVRALIAAAHKFNVTVIPFGGGSNIAGCLEARDDKNRMVVVLDMKRMGRVLDVDCHSMTARIQAGAMGPELEAELNTKGMTLGHFPDSFEYSSLGGWVATRSAGMKSDKYGKIEDMVISLRVVTPTGTIVTRTVPKSSNGIDVRHLCIGSEGILGVITEITLQVHHLPEKNVFYGYLFPDFESGISALYECAVRDCLPSMTRLNDAEKTALSFAYKSKGPWITSFISRWIKRYLKYIKRFDMDKVCLLLVGFEGSKKNVALQKKNIHAIYKQFGGVSLGTSPGRAFEKGKYDFPYLRDFAMDHGIIADVSETSTVWSNLHSLYLKTVESVTKAIEATGSKAWCACHISHTYRTGASLYFTFGFSQKSGDVLEQYLQVKQAAEDCFMQYGGTLSHHHAVGYEHMPWIEEDISATGMRALQGIKMMLDPKGIMNPGKIISTILKENQNV